MAINENELLRIIENASDDKVYEASDSLGAIGSKETFNTLMTFLNHDNPEVIFLASRTLGLMKENDEALEPLFEAINDKKNASIAGDLMMALEGFDVSEHYVTIFKLYLFGSFKVSKMAKEFLDFKEFNITPRVLKKVNKHWSHYQNNVKHDDAFDLQKQEVEEMLVDIQQYIDSSKA